MNYKIYNSSILPEVKIIEPTVFRDNRGEIYSSYHESLQSLLPEGMRFNHDKFTTSKTNVLRGLHGDRGTWKLISCIYGMVFQVVVDPTFKKWDAFVLHPHDRQILIPPGFLNGYYAYTESVYHYKLAYKGDYTDAKDQVTVKWDSLGIQWPCLYPIISERDNQ
jgi:dTDP-4-dehydrorhamnose 3,5-epimerase